MEFFPVENPVLQEFEKITACVHAHCISELGMKHCTSMQVLNLKAEIEQLLIEVNEFKVILTAGEDFPLNNYFLLDKELKLLALENSVLEEESILRMRAFLQTMLKLFAFFKEKGTAFPQLAMLFSSIQFDKRCLELIDKIFDVNGNIYDDASEDLLHIRRNLGKVRSEVSKVY